MIILQLVFERKHKNPSEILRIHRTTDKEHVSAYCTETSRDELASFRILQSGGCTSYRWFVITVSASKVYAVYLQR